jgi:hypothetical protein
MPAADAVPDAKRELSHVSSSVRLRSTTHASDSADLRRRTARTPHSSKASGSPSRSVASRKHFDFAQAAAQQLADPLM